MTEGTKSYLFGCHHFFFHPLWVMIAWIKHFKCLPRWWEFVCIILHDIGIYGKNYLSGDKSGHWVRGAVIADKLFGLKGFMLIAGHTTESRFPKSKLFRADKESWLIAPKLWMWWNHFLEDFGSINPTKWRGLVKENLNRRHPKDSHQLFLDNHAEKIINESKRNVFIL